MFHIKIRTVDANDTVINTAISGSFVERREAVAHLDKMVARLQKPEGANFQPNENNAGYDGKQDMWWTREDRTQMRYTIET